MDPLIKSQLLYQLSYAPPGNARSLAKPRALVDTFAGELPSLFPRGTGEAANFGKR